MPAGRPNRAKQSLTEAASKLIREKGYADTSLDDICAAAGVTRGALFHNFEGKEDLVQASLADWRANARALLESLAAAVDDPVARVDFTIARFADVLASPEMIQSCLAGTLLQEVSETHEPLRRSAYACLATGQAFFEGLIQQATAGRPIDAKGLAEWLAATVQGVLILYKGSRDREAILRPLGRVRQQIMSEIHRAMQPTARSVPLHVEPDFGPGT
jgi:TetR/AcrR family transcriptional regulator, transcriptional repressor for nem operon